MAGARLRKKRVSMIEHSIKQKLMGVLKMYLMELKQRIIQRVMLRVADKVWHGILISGGSRGGKSKRERDSEDEEDDLGRNKR